MKLEQIKIFLLDEADRMLDMGFIHDVKKIIGRIPAKRQTIFFSATMPAEISKLADTILTNPVRVEVTPPSSTANTVKQEIFFVEKNNKRLLLLHLLKDDAINTAIRAFFLALIGLRSDQRASPPLKLIFVTLG